MPFEEEVIDYESIFAEMNVAIKLIGPVLEEGLHVFEYWGGNYRQLEEIIREMDEIIYPVCKLCRDHERSGFVEGIKVGIRLRQELTNERSDTT